MKYEEVQQKISTLENALRYAGSSEEAKSIQFEINRLKQALYIAD